MGKFCTHGRALRSDQGVFAAGARAMCIAVGTGEDAKSRGRGVRDRRLRERAVSLAFNIATLAVPQSEAIKPLDAGNSGAHRESVKEKSPLAGCRCCHYKAKPGDKKLKKTACQTVWLQDNKSQTV